MSYSTRAALVSVYVFYWVDTGHRLSHFRFTSSRWCRQLSAFVATERKLIGRELAVGPAANDRDFKVKTRGQQLLAEQHDYWTMTYVNSFAVSVYFDACVHLYAL